MQLLTIDTSAIRLELDAEDFLILSAACRLAADAADDGGMSVSETARLEGIMYRAFAFAFEGYATVSQAQILLHPKDYKRLGLAEIRKDWKLIPDDREVTE